MRLYTSAQVRELDRTAIDDFSVPSYELMCRAGKVLADLVRLRWLPARRILILCGAGNNGGDGYVLARLLNHSHQVTVCATLAVEKLKGDAQRACQDYLDHTGHALLSAVPENLNRYDLIVDAVFGSGLARPVTGEIATLFERVNAAASPVLAVDVPSGLDASTGQVLGQAIRADVTVTFIGKKRGLLTHQGVDYSGTVIFASLDIPAAVYDQVEHNTRLLDAGDLPLLSRSRNAHKGSCGSCGIVGGNHGMQGAVALAGRGALRSGAGLVRLYTRNASAACFSQADLIVHELAEPPSTASQITTDVCVAGPGLGTDAWAQALLQQVINRCGSARILDADALNLIARDMQQDLPDLGMQTVLTPHPAEAARLLGVTTAEVQADRFTAVSELAQKYNSVVVLKGAGTLVCNGQQIRLCDRGNPGMATAGMGDVLAGVIGGLMAQGLTAWQAAQRGVLVHALAGDAVSMECGYGLVASDVAEQIAATVRSL